MGRVEEGAGRAEDPRGVEGEGGAVVGALLVQVARGRGRVLVPGRQGEGVIVGRRTQAWMACQVQVCRCGSRCTAR